MRLGKQFLFALLCILAAACKKDNPQPNPDAIVTVPTQAKTVSKTNSQIIYVDYQPWFDNKNTSANGAWGQHWTMANQNPDIILPDGRRQIASHFYPLIGPYASEDRDVIDYHLLLMKYAGVDGVIIDWYGTHNVYDYPLNRRNTDSIFSRVPGVGLTFAVCYEDQTLTHVQDIAGIDPNHAAKDDFAYLRSQYFKYSHYATIADRPLVLCFGPQVLKTPDEWTQIFSSLTIKPKLISLNYFGDETGSSGSGEFVWVGPDNLVGLQGFYQNRVPQIPLSFAGAYPGFKDFYKEGGWGDNLFTIDHNGTSTLQSTLDLAKASHLPYVHLITWNDFGEGTMLEPTLEFQFTFLETIQQYTGVSYTKVELQLIYQWYTLRKKYFGNHDAEKKLDEAYTALVSLDVAKATEIITSLP